MSPPAQNDRPTALTTSAPTSARPSTSSKTPISSCAIPGVSALRRSGALRVTTATAPSKSSSTSPESATSPPFSREEPARETAGPGSLASDHGPGDAAAAGQRLLSVPQIIGLRHKRRHAEKRDQQRKVPAPRRLPVASCE